MLNLKNFFYNNLGAFLPLISTILSVPIFLEIYGQERYGVHVIIWLIVGYLGLFDLGLGPAITILLSRLNSKRPNITQAYVKLAIFIALCVGLISTLILITFTNSLTIRFVGISDIMYREFKFEIYLLLLIVPLSTVGSIICGLHAARENFRIINIANVSLTILFHWLPIIASWSYSPSIGIIFYSATIAKVIQFVILSIGVESLHFRFWKTRFRLRQLKVLIGIGSWLSVSKLCAPILSATDRYVISSTLGVTNVAFYNLPYQIADKIALFASTITTLIVPKLSNKNDLYKNQVSFISQFIMTCLSFISNALGIVLIYPFLDIWIGNTVQYDFGLIPSLLVLGFSLNVLAYVPFTHMQTNGLGKITALIHVIEIPCYIICSIAFTVRYGLVGMASTFVVRIFIDTILMTIFSKIKLNKVKFVIFPIIINLLIFACISFSMPIYFINICIIIIISYILHHIYSSVCIFRDLK